MKSVHKTKNEFVYTSMIKEVKFDFIKIFEQINVLKKVFLLVKILVISDRKHKFDTKCDRRFNKFYKICQKVN